MPLASVSAVALALLAAYVDWKTWIELNVSVLYGLPLVVNAITLMADAIRQATGDPSLATRIPAMAERLQANARSLSRLISDLLDVTQFDSGRIDVQESIFSLNELLIEQCANLDLLIRGKSLRIGFNPPNRPIWLRTDRIKLARVITNILGNAIKFTDTGSITVSVCVTHDDVLIHIRDTGVGIALEHLDHIFDEFAQLRTANITHDEGWGLGLSICRRLMRALEGSIEVASEPGKGSVFTIRLPARRLVDPPAPWGAST